MRALITGITGFVGGHLAARLLADRPDAEVFGLRRWRSSIDGRHALDAVHLLEGDLLDPSSLLRALETARPDAVFHLAASSSVAGSWHAPVEMMQVNVIGTLHLLEAVARLGLDCPVVVACSAEPYGQVPETEQPIVEDRCFHPLSPYAVSKAAVDLLAEQAHASSGLRTVRLRLFNHCGPGQPDRFVVAALARQVAEIEAGLRAPRVVAGNLDARRDFVDVRDVARAYLLAAARGEAGAVYNIASGCARSIREVLDALIARVGQTIEVSCDEDRLRPADITVLAGDAARFHAATGWRPGVPFERTLDDTLDDWRSRVRA